jgi:hypothetical protein
MHRRYLAFAFGLAVALLLAQGQIAAQTRPAKGTTAAATRTWTLGRTADGQPDLQGVWANNNATPLERPPELNGRAKLTDEEVAALKAKAGQIFGGDGDAAFGDTIFRSVLASVKEGKSAPHQKAKDEIDFGTGDYNSFWLVPRDWDNRTSLITDPPDGRQPAMTPQGQQRRDAARAALNRPAVGPEDRSLSERCITFGTPSLRAGYNSYYQIIQTPGYVVIEMEMAHDARIIPLDGRPHPPAAVRQWMGDSRGHWEGDTLVVDTANYAPGGFQAASSAKLHVIERFTRTGPENIKYEFTIDDPDTWTKPWSVMIPLRHSPDKVFEYACHEGNTGLEGILSGARADEKAAQKKSGGQ